MEKHAYGETNEEITKKRLDVCKFGRVQLLLCTLNER